MRKPALLFISILLSLVLLPIFIFSRDASVEDAQFVLGKELYEMGRYGDAIAEFNRLLFEFGSFKYADACHFYIGNSFFSMKDYDKAIHHFKLVVDRYGAGRYGPPSLYLIGRAEFLQNRLQEAVSHFTAYAKQYPGLEFADNSLYWKGEAFVDLGEIEKAKGVFSELLRKYPEGNKADAARFKLRLLELEEELEKCYRETGEVRSGEDLENAIAQKQAEVERRKEKESLYTQEIARLNDQAEYLRSENERLKAIGTGKDAEQKKQIEEKIQALISLENLLDIKEKALKEKERRLNEAFESLMKSKGGK